MMITCNTANWALSRYDDENTQSLVNYKGVLLRATEQGLFALIGNNDDLTAFVDYGRLDHSRQLTRPDSCLVEYAKQGSLTVTVTETQSGKADNYTYELPQETADDLTNGRAKFGRGLKGRHFSYRINFNGKYAQIEDAYIDFVTTKRRI